MANIRIRLNKAEWMTVYILGGFLFVELLVLLSLVHFAKFPIFIPLFIKALKLLTPVFLAINAAFLLAIGFVKGKSLIVSSWKTYFSELLRFFGFSLLVTIALMTISALIGALLGLMADRLNEASSTGGFIGALREWVQQNFH
ncbi:MAG: hypothetical protein V3S04_02285 [Candidatus Omnitrophota bacterium]